MIESKQDLIILSKSYILQLNINDTKVYNDILISHGYNDNANNNTRILAKFLSRLDILQLLPNIWILDEDFISYNERKYINTNINTNNNNNNDNSNFMNRHFTQKLSDRQLIMLRAIQNIPQTGQLSDSMKLEIILEDYLEYARIFNKYCYPSLKVSKKPTINIFGIMQMPHKIRIDFSVLLTMSIGHKIPQEIYVDALIVLLNKYLTIAEIKDIAILPCYLRTAVVLVIRKICYRELIEISHFNALSEKPKMSDFHSFVFTTDSLEHPDCPIPTFELDGGFQHLGPLKHYLHRPLHRDSLFGDKKPLSYIPFSDLELELLEYLPDAPTRSTFFDMKKYKDNFLTELNSNINGNYSINKKEYKLDDWLGLAARHAVILLSKSSHCPSLTKHQNTKRSQKLYEELLPLLNCASLSYVDLGLQKTGPVLDGRIPNPNPKSDMAKIQKGGKVLGFGLGLPRNTPASLAWNSTDHKIDRKPLFDNKTFDDNSSQDSDVVDFSVAPTQTQRRPYSPTRVMISLDNSNHNNADNELSQYSSQINMSIAADEKLSTDMNSGFVSAPTFKESASSPINIRKGSNSNLSKKVRNNSTLPLKPISAFTSDENWAPVFVLASTANTEGNIKYNCWDELSRPPVLVNPVIDLDGSANNKFFLTINTSPPKENHISNNESISKETISFVKSFNKNEETEYIEGKMNDSIDDSFQEKNSLSQDQSLAEVSSSFMFVDNQDDNIDIVTSGASANNLSPYLNNNLSPYPNIMDKIYNNTSMEEVKLSLIYHLYLNFYHHHHLLFQAKLRLLAEMGTLKNLRRASIKKVGSKVKPPTSIRIKSSADKNMANNNETFLTSNRDDFGDDTASADLSKFSMNEEDQDQNDKNFKEYVQSISKILDTDRRSNKMDRSYSYSDLLKLRFNYDSIYTNTGGVERGNRNFYPVYKKFMYLLDKNALKHSFNESNNGTVSRAESPTSPTMLNVANEDNKIAVHISNVRYTDSPGSVSPTGSRNNSPPRTIKSQNSNISVPQQQESFLFGSTGAGTVVGTVVDSIKPSNTFLNDSLNIEGGSSTYLNKLVKNLTSEQAFITPYSYADEKPKRSIKYFEPSKNEVYLLDPYLVDTSMTNIMEKSKSKMLKASSSIGNTKDPHISGLRTSTLIHKSSTAKLKLNAAFKIPNPNPNLNPNLKPNFKDLPPLVSKKMKMSESK